ncbi:unnamed protein product [Penicillium nalgiovense]|nr:unnamed protein product [Penicillium nalgiovense]
MGSSRKYRTVFHYDSRYSHHLKNDLGFLDRSIITDITMAEHALREQTQREETLKYKATALDSDACKTALEEANTQLEKARRQYPRKEQALYRAESMLPPTFRCYYDGKRHDAAWFMCEGMVRDCSDRGGCCSRGCGCCARRHLSDSEREKGRGHCTSECWCCISFRGFELPEDEKKEITDDIESRLKKSHSPYLLNMANCFFCPLKPEGLPKSTFTLRRLRKG